MSNLSIFNSRYLERLVDPFIADVTNAIVPIRYEALTPDLFALLFCLTDTNSVEHFFVSLEFDHIDGIDGARCTIEDWHAELLEFVPLANTVNTDEMDLESYRVKTTGSYYAMLAKVGRPTGFGYWSSKVVILPGDNINEKIAHCTKKQQETIKKTILQELQHRPNPDQTILGSFNTKFKDTVVGGVNVTDMIVTIYLKKDGSFELFTNFKK